MVSRVTFVIVAGFVGSLGLSSISGATPPTTPVVSLVTGAPNGPFSSGQFIEVKVGPNSVLKHHHDLVIEECSAPTSAVWHWKHECDRRTIQVNHLRAGHHGTVDYTGYPIYALPDSTMLGEGTHHHPVCDLTHACVIMVGWDIEDAGQEVWSLPFFVNPTAGDTGSDPGNGLPEAPYVLAFPALALAGFGGWVLYRRRKPGIQPN